MRLRSFAALGILSVLLAGCFEDPVSETMAIDILPDDRLAVVTTVAISENLPESALAARSRIEKLRENLLSGSDEWSRRYRFLESPEDSYTQHRKNGKLNRVERRAVILLHEIGRLLADSGITVQFSEDDDWEELIIHTGPSQRASRAQREELERTFRTWTAAIASYFESLRRLYSYLETHPERAKFSFQILFDEAKLDAVVIDEEKAILTEVTDKQNAVTEIFNLGEKDAYSLNEISSLVFDPFPAKITVKLPGQLLETEGFTRLSDDRVVIRPMNLWDALESLDGKWVTPDPLILEVRRDRAGENPPPLDIDAIAAQPRSASVVPTPTQIRQALEAKLTVSPLYRVRWKAQPRKPPKD